MGQAIPFSTSEADRGWLALSGSWLVADPVLLRASWQGLAARWPSGVTALGSGDLRLGTRARVWERQRFRTGLDWEVKLPNADDTTGLGSDETDLLARAWVSWSEERWTAQLDGGLAILGDPLHASAQDDAALLGLRAALALGPVWLDGRVDTRLPSPRNPLDAELALGVTAGPRQGRLRAHVEGSVGLSPAAADFGARLSLALVPRDPGT